PERERPRRPLPATDTQREHDEREAGERHSGRRCFRDDEWDPAEQLTEAVPHRWRQSRGEVDEPGGCEHGGRATANPAPLHVLVVHASTPGLMVHCPTLTESD